MTADSADKSSAEPQPHCKRRIATAALPNVDAHALARSFVVPSSPFRFVRCRPDCAAGIRCLFAGTTLWRKSPKTLPRPNFPRISRNVIPASRENDRLVSLVPLCFVGAAFFVLLAPAFMRPRFIVLQMPFVIRVFPPPQLFGIMCIVPLFLRV